MKTKTLDCIKNDDYIILNGYIKKFKEFNLRFLPVEDEDKESNIDTRLVIDNLICKCKQGWQAPWN